MHIAALPYLLGWGLFLLWLVTVVPAAVACGVRGRWGTFALGFLTLGVAWFHGAVAGLGKGRRFRLLRSGVAVSAALVAILAFGLVGLRPAGLFGVDAKTLATSFNGHSLFTGNGGCRSEGGGEFVCFNWGGGIGSNLYASRIEVNEVGCWHQVPFGDRPVGKVFWTDGHRRGCVHLDDYV